MYYEINILNLLMERPHYGYEIRKRMSDDVGACTNISNNTLYPILRRFLQKGITEKKTECVDNRPPRIIYTITDKGRKTFVQLLWGFPDALMDNREEFATRMSFFHYMSKSARKRALDLREKKLRHSLEMINNNAKNLNPSSSRMAEYYMQIIRAEQEVIDFFRLKVDESCSIDEDGNFA